ncbi:MAG: hypothetical protein J6S71_06615 [Clostridia bacterium]|nr:hypothetical protein [Clostridia bacterium]
MTTYELYRKISNILAPNNNRALFDYIIHSTDNYGGFLRSRFCRADITLPDKKCGEINTVLVALAEPFDFSSREYYRENGSLYQYTALKMQIYLCDLSDGEKFRFVAEGCASVGYEYPIKIKLDEKKYEILDRIVIS